MIVLLCLRVPYLPLLRFQLTWYVETSALNDPKMTLNTTRSNLPRI